MKNIILTLVLAIPLILGIVLARASTVTAIDNDDVIVTDDTNVSKPYTGEQLNSWFQQVNSQDTQALKQSVASYQRLQTSDEAFVQVGRILQVFQNEVITNSYNAAQTL